MKDFLSVICSSQLFSGVTETELTAVLACLDAKKNELPEGSLSYAYRRYGGSHRFCVVGKRSDSSGGYLGEPSYSVQRGTGADICCRICLCAGCRAECQRGCANACHGDVSECQAHSVRVYLCLLPSQPDYPQSLGELADNLMLSEKVSHMGQRTTRAKVMSYLSAQAQKSGAYEFDIPFSRQQLADYLAVERSGLSVELCKMRDEGLLEFHKSHFVLKV